MSNHDSSKRCDFVIQNDYSLWGRDPGPGVASMRRGLGNGLCAVESVRYGLSDWKSNTDNGISRW